MIDVRAASEHDGQALSAIDAATWSPHVTPAPAREPGAQFFSDRLRPSDVLVAETGSHVVGYVMLNQTIPLPSHRHVLQVNGLAVDPAHQGRGIGRRLVQEVKEEARRREARKLSLRVLSQNTAGRRLYESCGFTVEGVLVGEFVLDGALVDDILMACWLDRPV